MSIELEYITTYFYSKEMEKYLYLYDKVYSQQMGKTGYISKILISGEHDTMHLKNSNCIEVIFENNSKKIYKIGRKLLNKLKFIS